MTYILIAIILGAFAFQAGKQRGGRRNTGTGVVREAGSDRQVGASVRREPPVARRAKVAAPIEAPIMADTPVSAPTYLLGSRRADGAVDEMAAMMDMMAGPGVCTPRTP
jgi:hypothetical protein